MGLLDALKYEKPLCHKNLGIAKLVREHFDEIQDARDKSYSWRQIADTINTRAYIPTKNLRHSITATFFNEKKKRKTD